MAILIPENIPLHSTHGEKEMARVLRRLPEDWIIYFEPRVRGLHPDFVILAPDLGVLVLEIKDWQINSLISLTPHQVERTSRGPTGKTTELNPLSQLRKYWTSVVQECSTNLFGQALFNKTPPWEGRLCFPVGKAVVFTRISTLNVMGSSHRSAWEAIFTPDHCIPAEVRRSWDDLGEEGLVEALRPYFRPFAMAEPFSAHQIDILRWILSPESRLDVILSRSREDHDRGLKVLDARQEQHARSLGSGHRILSGVAGSGKTVLLLARARWLAAAIPEQKTLLLCYNKILAEWLGARMADCPNVTVRHFDGFASNLKLGRRLFAGKGHAADADDGIFGARVLAELQKRGDSARVWDTVLIDEAQDFEPVWFQCAMAVMRDPVDGDLVIVADGSQRLYRRNGLSWKSLGVKAAGRSICARYDLDKNYRNTPKIAALAWHYSEDEVNDDGIHARRVTARNCRRSDHSQPVFVDAGGHAAQVDAALEVVGRWIRGERAGHSAPPLLPEEIGILYPKLGANQELLQRLLVGLGQLAPAHWLNDKRNTRSHEAVNLPAIKVQTIHSAKGLQYKAVLVLWTDMLPQHQEKQEEERRLLYVAITRAENDLVLLGQSSRGFSAELAARCRVIPWPFRNAA